MKVECNDCGWIGDDDDLVPNQDFTMGCCPECGGEDVEEYYEEESN